MVGSKRIKLFHERKTWGQAKKFCNSIGGELVSIIRAYENDIVANLIGQVNTSAAGKKFKLLGKFASIECQCCEKKTMIITTANQGKNNFTGSQWALKVKTSKRLEARKNASGHWSIGISFESDWFRGSCKFSKPNAKRTEAKQCTLITLDIQLKISLVRT